MRIDVQDGVYGDQTRAYAEYRIFSTLKNFGDIVRQATVTLTPSESTADARDEAVVVCRVTIHMTHDRRAEAAATGRHPYGAIDRAAQRVELLMKKNGGSVDADVTS
jgi:ribosome-associated translation inhibitor RaiA